MKKRKKSLEERLMLSTLALLLLISGASKIFG